MRATPVSDTVSPVSVAEFELWMGADNDGTFGDWLTAATDQVIGYINRDLLPRQWRLVINRRLDPIQVAYNRYPDRSFGYVELPFTNFISVQSVEVDGDAAEHEVDEISQPARVEVQAFGEQLEIVYTAGTAVVPSGITTAIKLMAQYLYEHAGECELGQVISKSGVGFMLAPYRIEYA